MAEVAFTKGKKNSESGIAKKKYPKRDMILVCRRSNGGKKCALELEIFLDIGMIFLTRGEKDLTSARPITSLGM